jgi:hypothetical protein
MDLKKMSKTELEALGYNQIKELQRIQYNIQMIEQELDKKNKEEEEKEVKPIK